MCAREFFFTTSILIGWCLLGLWAGRLDSVWAADKHKIDTNYCLVHDDTE